MLMKIFIKADRLSINLIQGRTKQVPFNSKIKDAEVNIDKGITSFFIKAKVK
jgi:hypothetical protein